MVCYNYFFISPLPDFLISFPGTGVLLLGQPHKHSLSETAGKVSAHLVRSTVSGNRKKSGNFQFFWQLKN